MKAWAEGVGSRRHIWASGRRIRLNLCCTSGLNYHEKEARRLYKLKKVLCWVFAFSSMVCLGITLRRISSTVHQHHSLLTLSNLRVLVVFSIQAVIFGVAWWEIWREKPLAAALGIVASLVFVLVSLWGMIFFSKSVWGNEGIVLAIGVVGLVAFSWPDKKH